VGRAVGACVGAVGARVGLAVGANVGCAVGDAVEVPHCAGHCPSNASFSTYLKKEKREGEGRGGVRRKCMGGGDGQVGMCVGGW